MDAFAMAQGTVMRSVAVSNAISVAISQAAPPRCLKGSRSQFSGALQAAMRVRS
jgi:hypothetical protein